MYVCVCKAVTEKQIHQAVASGARRMRDLRAALGVTAECGRCAGCAHACLRQALPTMPVANMDLNQPLSMEAA